MVYLTKWLNNVVKSGLFTLASLLSLHAVSQSLTLDSAIRRARGQYPLIRQQDLIRQTASLSIENLSKGYLPQVVINGQASYQSDVTSVNISIPGIKVESPAKDQYKVLADVSQVIYDGGLIRQQQTVQRQHAAVEEQKIEVELHQLKERITQLFLGIMLLQQQMKQVDLVKKDLQAGLSTVEAQVANELVLRSNLHVLKAEVLRTDQRLIELKAARKGLVDVLGLFLDQQLPEQIVLETPGVPEIANGSKITRPELNLFKDQVSLFQQQQKLVDARNRPRTSAFAQGGYGRPALNMLSNELEPFYIVGLRMNWSLGGLYTARKEKRLLEISQQGVNVQRELFLLNTGTQLKQQAAEIDKWNQLVATDKEIIDLRVSIKEAAKAQLENRVITANDYLREVNAEDAARQNLMLHQLQLLQAKINYQNLLGN